MLFKLPAIEKKDMDPEYEDLALKLVESGLVRIDTDSARNFVNLLDPDIDRSITLSQEQLLPALMDKTLIKLNVFYSKKFQGQALEQKIQTVLEYFRLQMAKNSIVEKQLMLKLVRIFAQAALPIVLKWLLLEQVEIYISYGHSIGDVMDVVNWQRAGSNSGMQSTDGYNVAVFVSCGGDPLAENSLPDAILGDGKPAMARLQIIAGQELGHFSDIIRNPQGIQIGRHSADFACTRAKRHVKEARKNDIAAVDAIHQHLIDLNFNHLLELEKQVRFYDKNHMYNFKINLLRANLYLKRLAFCYKAKKSANLLFALTLRHEKYLAIMLQAMLEDMLFNLTPQADVYSRDDPEAEEAIKCVEALARVPQQVMKWGYLATSRLMPGLYQIYYEEVIPSLTDIYKTLTGKFDDAI